MSKGLLAINSYNRNTGTSSNFDWFPGGGLEKYSQCYFHNASIPNTFTNITTYNQTINLEIGGAPFTITLPIDYYTVVELCQILQAMLTAFLGPGITFNVMIDGKVRIINGFPSLFKIFGTNDELLYMLGFTDLVIPIDVSIIGFGQAIGQFLGTEFLYTTYYIAINSLIIDQSYFPIYKSTNLVESIPIETQFDQTTYTAEEPAHFRLGSQTSAFNVRILDFKGRVIDLSGKNVSITMVLY